jgi:signal peptide peptidase SppA
MTQPLWTSLLYNEPLAITPLRNEALCQAAQLRMTGVLPDRIDAAVLDLKPRAFAHEANDYYGGERKPFPMKDGIAVVRTIGTLVKRGGWMEAESGLIGYDRVLGQMREAYRDADVKGIFWVIDSPGGHTARMLQAANEIAMMSKAEGGKPIYAYIDETAASAGFVLASAADVVLAPESALGGCLGVILNLVDSSKFHEKVGLEPMVVRSSWSDRKALGQPGEAISAEALEGYQKIVDDQGEMMVEFVAAMRGLSAKQIKDTHGDTFGAADMFQHGLLDEVCSESEAWALLSSEIRSL